MKGLKKIIYGMVVLMAIFELNACSDDPAPDHRMKDFGKMKLGRMDLTDAVSIGLKSGNASKAIDGEYLVSGLYKVDANGNISAVGVYFTTDTNGNRLEKEYALRVAPKAVFQVSSNFMLAIRCDYYDSDGDFVNGVWSEDTEEWINQSVPYRDLLVRVSDGKIWCVDNIGEYLYYYYMSNYRCSEFKEDYQGSLYCIHDYSLFKFDLSSDSPAFEQISTIDCFSVSFLWDISNNGVGWAEGYDFTFCWPKSGFQTIQRKDDIEKRLNDDYSFIFSDDINIAYKGVEVYGAHLANGNDIVTQSVSHNPILIAYPTYHIRNIGYNIRNYDDLVNCAIDRTPLAVVYDIFIGDTPGSAKMCNNPITLNNVPKELIDYRGWTYRMSRSKSCLVSGNEILVFFLGDNKTWISRIDLEKRTWEWLKEIDGIRMYVDADADNRYNGKIWIDDSDPENNRYGVQWFDLISLEIGSIPFNVDIPDYLRDFPSWERNGKGLLSGKVYWEGSNPMTGNREKIVVDFTTGELLTSSSDSPDLLFETIIGLN